MSFASLVGDKVYRLGSQGPVVQAIQLGLREHGYALKGTGYYGPATDTAVSSFQRRAGLTVDGRFGQLSAQALDSLAAPAPGGGASSHAAAPRAEVSRPLWLEAGLALIGTQERQGSGDNPEIIDWAKEEGG